MSAHQPPLVSICVPTFLGEKHLRACIDSVLAQDYSKYELIIIDDNSPDGTAELIDTYHDSRIRYLRNESNLGPEGNWNRCLAEARGQYFKLLPQDDLIYPGTLRKQVAMLESDTHERIALVFGARHIINAEGHTITTRGFPGAKTGVLPADQVVRKCVRFGTNLIGEPGSVLMRRSLAAEVGKFDGSIAYIIDLDYWVRLLQHGDAYYLAEPLSAFRVATGSWSIAIGNKQSEEYARFIYKVASINKWPISFADQSLGRAMAVVNKIMRAVFYRIYIRTT